MGRIKSVSQPFSFIVTFKLLELIKDSDFVLDFHEGWGFHRLNPDSLGSGIYPGDTHNAISLSYRIADSLNTQINIPHKKFVVLLNSHPELESLRSYCNYIRRDYILVETTGQNDIQPIEIRSNQMIYIINGVNGAQIILIARIKL